MHINYTSVVAFISYVLPHFLKLSVRPKPVEVSALSHRVFFQEQGRPSFIVTVTSGLSIVPLAAVANYSASKAALSSFTTSLRAQLNETNIKVLEIIPP